MPYDRIKMERAQQNRDYGAVRGYAPAKWLAILTEDVGEVASEVKFIEWPDIYLSEFHGARERMVAELVQVAAVAIAWIEAIIDKQDGPLFAPHEPAQMEIDHEQE